MKNLVIYDELGKIFSITQEPYVLPQGIRYYLEVEVPEGKKIMSIDVTRIPHVAVLEDIPPTELEMTREQINKLLPLLSKNDMLQKKMIDDLVREVNSLKVRCNQLELEVKNLKGGVQ